MFRAPVIGVTASLFLAAVVAVAAYDILAAVNTTRDAADRAAVTAVVGATIANRGKYRCSYINGSVDYYLVS